MIRNITRGMRTSAVRSTLYKSLDFPMTLTGRVTHLGVKAGDVANRILSVGEAGRARRIASFLDDADKGGIAEVTSYRGFTTLTGKYKGVPMSIIATGMGVPMMDFVVRETRQIIEGNMAIIRYGTSGGLHASAVPGVVAVADPGSCSVLRMPDAFHPEDTGAPYHITKLVTADRDITRLLTTALTAELGTAGVVSGTNVTADTFYATQGRASDHFNDKNQGLIERIRQRYPDAVSMEMETFHLLDLARQSHGGSIRAAAAVIVVANRVRPELPILDAERFQHLESQGGKAALDALAGVAL